MNVTKKHHQDFMEQLHELRYQRQKNIPLTCTHDVNSVCCSGDIVAIKVLCKCVESSDNLNDQIKKSPYIHVSNDVDSE